MTRKLATYFHDFTKHHRTRENQIFHFFGLYLIAFSLLGLLSYFNFESTVLKESVFRFDLGLLSVLLVSLFYLSLDWKISLPFSFVLFGLYFLGRSLPFSFLIFFQLFGWFLELYGHFKFEKKIPTFLQNLRHLFIGPLWFFAKTIGYIQTKENG